MTLKKNKNLNWTESIFSPFCPSHLLETFPESRTCRLGLSGEVTGKPGHGELVLRDETSLEAQRSVWRWPRIESCVHLYLTAAMAELVPQEDTTSWFLIAQCFSNYLWTKTRFCFFLLNLWSLVAWYFSILYKQINGNDPIFGCVVGSGCCVCFSCLVSFVELNGS